MAATSHRQAKFRRRWGPDGGAWRRRVFAGCVCARGGDSARSEGFVALRDRGRRGRLERAPRSARSAMTPRALRA